MRGFTICVMRTPPPRGDERREPACGRTPARKPCASTTNGYVHLDDATLSQASERIAIAIERDLRTIQWRPKVYSSKTPGAGTTPPSTGALP